MADIIPHDLRVLVACFNPVLAWTEYSLEHHFEKNDRISGEDIQAIKRAIQRLDKVRRDLKNKASQNLDQRILKTVYDHGWMELDKGIDDLLITFAHIMPILSLSEIEEIDTMVHIVKAFRRRN